MSLQPIMLTIFPPSEGGCSEGALDAFRAFFKQSTVYRRYSVEIFVQQDHNNIENYSITIRIESE